MKQEEIDRIQFDIESTGKDSLDERSWNSQEGVLISANEAKQFLSLQSELDRLAKENEELKKRVQFGNEYKQMRELVESLSKGKQKEV